MSTSLVSLDTSQYVRINTAKSAVLIQSFRDVVRIAFSASQPAFSNTAFHMLTPDHPPLRWDATDTNIWALATTDRCGLSITETGRPHDAQDDISEGLYPGVSQFNKFAFREVVTGGASFQTVWNSSATFIPLKTASTFTITYDNTTDGVGNTGALSLLISYIDDNEKQAQLNHVLGSSGSDVTTVSGFGINRVVVTSSGSSDINESDITITATTGGTTQAIVPANTGVTQQAIFFAPDDAVPITKWLWLNAAKTGGGSHPVITIKGWVYNRTVDSKFLIFQGKIDSQVQSSMDITDPCNFPLSRRDVLWFEMQSATNNTGLDMRFSTNLYSDD
jgi:hypothetical protein